MVLLGTCKEQTHWSGLWGQKVWADTFRCWANVLPLALLQKCRTTLTWTVHALPWRIMPKLAELLMHIGVILKDWRYNIIVMSCTYLWAEQKLCIYSNINVVLKPNWLKTINHCWRGFFVASAAVPPKRLPHWPLYANGHYYGAKTDVEQLHGAWLPVSSVCFICFISLSRVWINCTNVNQEMTILKPPIWFFSFTWDFTAKESFP